MRCYMRSPAVRRAGTSLASCCIRSDWPSSHLSDRGKTAGLSPDSGQMGTACLSTGRIAEEAKPASQPAAPGQPAVSAATPRLGSAWWRTSPLICAECATQKLTCVAPCSPLVLLWFLFCCETIQKVAGVFFAPRCFAELFWALPASLPCRVTWSSTEKTPSFILFYFNHL